MQRTTLPNKRPPCEDGKAEGWEKTNTPSGEVWTRQLTQEERAYNELQKAHYPDGRVESFFRILKAPADIGKEEAALLKKSFLDERHYTLLLDETGMVLTPDGRVLCILLKHRLPPDLLEAVRPVVREAAREPIAGGNRGEAAGTGMVKRIRPDGTESNINGVPNEEDLDDEHYYILKPAKGGTFGFNAREIRGGQPEGCRTTAYDGVLPEEWGLMSELAQEVGEAFRWSFVQDKWGVQFEKACQTPPAFVLETPDGPTPFTTVTCNKSFRTAAHVDKGDLKEGFGAMCCLGDFEGCDLVLPRYKVAVRYRDGDVLLADVANQVHGNTPLLNPDGTVPELHRMPERLACVFYCRKNMYKCLNSEEEENEAISNRKPGDPLWPKKKS
ncbi:MAG: hypothetical protein LAO08_00405 [Acidobacteriia bacterium]|nr:hypothetical protein [Terriglobia bacterium]